MMKSQRFSKYPRINPATQASVPWKKTFWWAWNIFAFSAAFAVLFNAFYIDGIELKFKPHQKQASHPFPAPTYPGLTQTTKATLSFTATPAPTEPNDPFPRLSIIGVKDRFDKNNCMFLDARKPEDYQAGHIPGALNFYGNELDHYAPTVLPQLPDKNKEIIAYCEGGDCDLSLQVAHFLAETGYRRVVIFEGGWPDWKKAGYPTHEGDMP